MYMYAMFKLHVTRENQMKEPHSFDNQCIEKAENPRCMVLSGTHCLWNVSAAAMLNTPSYNFFSISGSESFLSKIFRKS